MSFQYDNQEEENFETQQSPQEVLEERKSVMRKRSFWAIGIGAVVILAHLAIFIVVQESLSLVFQSIFFILGLLALTGGLWGLYEAQRMTLEDLTPSPEAIEFARQGVITRPYFSYIFIGCFVAVLLAQMNVGLDESAQIAGLIKSDVVDKGEFWRLLTSGALHYGFLHIYFNSQAFYGFGDLIEYLSNRAHLAIVFVLSVIGGNVLSLIFMPQGVSIGASGGVMGLIGYLAIYGYRRKRQLPSDFLRSLIVNIAFISAFGIIGYQFINNAAHLGGLITGAIYGFLQIPKNLDKNPRQVSALVEALGYIALGLFVFTSILSILLILKIIIF